MNCPFEDRVRLTRRARYALPEDCVPSALARPIVSPNGILRIGRIIGDFSTTDTRCPDSQAPDRGSNGPFGELFNDPFEG